MLGRTKCKRNIEYLWAAKTQASKFFQEILKDVKRFKYESLLLSRIRGIEYFP